MERIIETILRCSTCKQRFAEDKEEDCMEHEKNCVPISGLDVVEFQMDGRLLVGNVISACLGHENKSEVAPRVYLRADKQNTHSSDSEHNHIWFPGLEVSIPWKDVIRVVGTHDPRLR